MITIKMRRGSSTEGRGRGYGGYVEAPVYETHLGIVNLGRGPQLCFVATSVAIPVAAGAAFTKLFFWKNPVSCAIEK